jgi:transcriptional regulator GlxA family with amidase domain
MDAKAPVTRAARRSLYADALTIVQSEYGDQLTLDVVARRVATSRRHLQRVFAEVGGTSFSDCLTRVRLERAADMLRSDNRPIPEIARAVGFRSPAGFSVAFRRRFGISPGAIRDAKPLAHGRVCTSRSWSPRE